MEKRKYIKCIGIFLLIMTFNSSVMAQYHYYYRFKPWDKYQFSIQSGLSWPYDRFGNHSNLNFSSFATPGYNVTLQSIYFYTPNFGVGINLMLNINPVDNKKLAQAYVNSKDAFIDATATVSPFYETSVLMGIYYQVPLSDYFAFTFSMLAGMQTVYKPAGRVYVKGLFVTIPFVESKDEQTNFVFYYKFGMQIKLYRLVYLEASAAYIGSTYNFEYYRNNNKILQKQHIGELMFRLGVAFKF